MDYNFIAPYYDFLSRIVFGKAQLKAQISTLKFIQPSSEILIAGGGSGEIMSYIPESIRIDFVEISLKMVSKAQKRKHFHNVHWHQEDIFSFVPQKDYDIIFLPFLLDNFCAEQTERLIMKLKAYLNPNGTILITDFTETPKIWQKAFLNLMYAFFKIVANIKVNEMPPVNEIMARQQFKLFFSEKFYFGLIEARKYTQ